MPPTISQICLVPFDFAPRGWMFCDGSILPISENESLFQILGNTYGGDGETTFGLPNLSAAAPAHCHYCISLFGTFSTNVYDGVLGETLPWSTKQQRPNNLLECTGGTFPKSQWFLLGEYLKNRFGGDGVNTIGLPNLTGKFPAQNYRYLITASGSVPDVSSQNWELFVAQLMLLPYSEKSYPKLMLCDGRMLPIEGNTALFALLGKKFGGNDKQFAIPDLRSSVPVANYNYYLVTTGFFPPRG